MACHDGIAGDLQHGRGSPPSERRQAVPVAPQRSAPAPAAPRHFWEEAGSSQRRSTSTLSSPSWLASDEDDEDVDDGWRHIPADHFLAQQGRKTLPNGGSPSRSSAESPSGSSATGGGLQPLSELAAVLPEGLRPQGPNPFPAQNTHEGAAAVAHETGMPDTSTLAAADFDIDVRSGFLPPEAPLSRLSGIYEEWEMKLEEASNAGLSLYGGGPTTDAVRRARARRWRRSLRQMPVLPLDDVLLGDIRHARRAHLVLSFLAHYYLHSQPAPTEVRGTWLAQSQGDLLKRSVKGKQRQHEVSLEAAYDAADASDEAAGAYAAVIPASLAVPWTGLARHLDLPPILTYATTVLWNWEYKDPSRGLALDNVKIRNTFSGTTSEEHFYLISLLIELRGVEALELMRISLDEAFVADRLARRRIAHYLRRLVSVVHDLTTLLAKMKEGCDPVTFYWGIRPWFRGGDSAPGGGLGWFYQGADEPGQRRLLNGPSAGQSSLIHALDVFLDIDHTRLKPRIVVRDHERQLSMASASSEQEAGAGENATFMEKMQLYMPGPHRAFLTHLRNLSFDDDHATAAHLNGTTSRSMARTAVGGDGEPVHSKASDEMDVDTVPPPPSHPIRSLAMAKDALGKPFEDDLPSAYDAALMSLRALRDEHMRIAALYIVSQARKQPPAEYAPMPQQFTGRAEVERMADGDAKSDAPKGTGGTDLVSFLKACRSNTTDALLHPAPRQ